MLGGPGQTDSDGDGLTDRFEALLDTDHDGLTDTFEQQMGTLAPASDGPAGGLHAALPFVADPTFH